MNCDCVCFGCSDVPTEQETQSARVRCPVYCQALIKNEKVKAKFALPKVPVLLLLCRDKPTK